MFFFLHFAGMKRSAPTPAPSTINFINRTFTLLAGAININLAGAALATQGKVFRNLFRTNSHLLPENKIKEERKEQTNSQFIHHSNCRG
jgi:hypothetical protein